MRRKIRFKVLYWPALASTCIILILISFGPLSTVIRPSFVRLWAGSDLGTKINLWFPNALGARSVTLPWIDLAENEAQKPEHRETSRPRSAPRTLLVQSQGQELSVTTDSVDPRNDLDGTASPRAVHSPHALRVDAANESSRLAEATLFAPVRDDNEELAGVDRTATTSMRLASQANPISNASHPIGSEVKRTSSVHVGDDIRDSTKRIAESARRGHGLGGGWPETPQLKLDLESFARVASRKGTTIFVSLKAPSFSMENWQADVTQTLSMLTALPSVTSRDAGPILSKLQSLATAGHEAGESFSDRELQIRLLRVAHGLDRRLAIWIAVWRTTQGVTARLGDVAPIVNESGIETYLVHSSQATYQAIAALQGDAMAAEDSDGWLRFLMIDELEAATQSSSADLRRIAAQRFLSRLTWHQLGDEQRKWLDRDTVHKLENAVRRWAASPLDYAALLAQIERQESDAIDLGGIDVASAVQTLRFAESAEANRIAQSLNTYYRNANIRVAITDGMIERLIPEVDAKVQPVRDVILGADVRGTSVAKSDLSLKLIPSDHSWKLVLENNGRVSTGAASRQWPVLIRSDSEASFLSSTPLEISASGAVAGSTGVAVRSATKVRGLSTEFDSIPLVNSLVREIAMNRYDSMAPLAQQIQKSKIRRGVSAEVDAKVSEQLDEASKTLSQRLTGPLGTLRLSPMVVDMETTETRLSARYRVAGDWQLAAFSPRPRAPMASLMSVQIHQSALNNTLETILPSGEPKTISELIDQIKQLFMVNDGMSLGDDDQLAAETSIQFASTRPITVEIEDDILWITLRVMRLKQNAGIDLRRFIVRAGYKPQVDGLSANLVRVGHLRISGPDMSMRDRLPVRAIFNKVFSARRTLPIVPAQWLSHPALEGLAVTQAELRDGWIAVAIGNASDTAITPQIARSEEDDAALSY